MLRSELKTEFMAFWFRLGSPRAGFPVLFLLITLAGLRASAPAQTSDFTLQATAFQPAAVDPGGVTTSIITVGAVNGFTGTVILDCAVTSEESVPPGFCEVSPSQVQPPEGATATINAGSASPGFYSVTITGHGPSRTQQSSTPQDVTILSVLPGFTITVQAVMDPASVPAGNQSSGTININPLNGYRSPGGSAGVTLSCASISPLVTIPPICSFTPPSPTVNGTVQTAQVNISTFGPVVTTGSVAHPRHLYALWLPLPMLLLAGFGAAIGGKRSRRACGLFAIFVVGAAFLLMPACSNTQPYTTTDNGVTPANTYTFTIVGVDSNGIVSSNSSSSNSPSVTLTVTAPAPN